MRTQTWRAAYEHVFGAARLGGLSDDAGAEMFRRFIGDPYPHMHTLVAEHDGEIVGFATLGATRDEPDKGLGELFAIYVLPDEWGRGTGRALMTSTVERLKGEGFAAAILWVLDDNPRTRRFYELAGWHADGGVKNEDLLGTPVREIRYRIMF